MMTDAELSRFIAAWERAVNDPKAWRRSRREDLRRNLTRRARFRLWRGHAGNMVLIWLCRTRKGARVAGWLWRM